MTTYTYRVILAAVLLLALGGYVFFITNNSKSTPEVLDPTPYNVTLSGTYVCLPHLDTKGPQTMECAFGLQADDGNYYAVNFGQGAEALNQFRAGERITAEGFVVIKEALSTDQWQKYNMKGIFTITKLLSSASTTTKLDINVICQEALAYMTFPDAKSADKFVAECKEGKHPEVIEAYKERMGLGTGAAI